MDPEKSTENGVEDRTGSNDEDTAICDQESVASSVDSIAEDMFIDGLDFVLDLPSSGIYPPEEDCDSKTSLQQRKRSRLSSPSSTADGGGRESKNDGFSGVSTERWHSSEEADVEPLKLDFSPVQEPGPQILPHSSYSPLQFFQLFFPEKMLQSIVGHTNVYGAKCKDVGDQWLYVTLKDLKLYIALVIYTGLVKCSLLTDYWRESQFSPSFPAKVMSYQKFVTIANSLHFTNTNEDEENDSKKGTAAYERLGKILPVYQLIREACKSYFHPFQNITIDERIVAAQPRTGPEQRIENKSTDRGYKLFALSDCTCGYTWDFFIYEGKSCTSQSEGLSYESVMALMDENMLGSGYKLFVDKFYTSPRLFRDLLCKKIWACGPVLPTRKGFPQNSVNRLSRKTPRGTMRWIREDKLLFVEWKDRAEKVQMCSTFHKANDGDTVQRKVKGDPHRTLVEVPVPAVVMDYSRNVGTVDPSNFITGHYRVLHKPKKWYQCVFYHLLDIAVENAFILHELVAKRKKQKALTRKGFVEKLILELRDKDDENMSGSAPVDSTHPPASSSSSTSTPCSASPEPSVTEGSHKPKYLMSDSTVGRRKCRLCHQETPIICVTCEVPLCFQPKRDCYNSWHEQID